MLQETSAFQWGWIYVGCEILPMIETLLKKVVNIIKWNFTVDKLLKNIFLFSTVKHFLVNKKLVNFFFLRMCAWVHASGHKEFLLASVDMFYIGYNTKTWQ